MKALPFLIVDVFADAPYKGNQLAVFLNASGLTTAQMQGIAQEIGFAESAFILSEDATEKGVALRIFTVEYEVPFAGHPTLGSAFVVQQFLYKKPVPEVRLQVKVGQIPVSISYAGAKPDYLSMRQLNPSFQPPLPAAELAPVLGLPVSALDSNFPVQEVSTGLPFLLIPLLRLQDMQQLQVNPDLLYAFLMKHSLYKTQRTDGLTVAFYCFCPETYSPDHQLNARMFALENGQVIEVAATGSANGCLLGYLLKHAYFQKNELDLLVEQGYELGRNAIIKLKGEMIQESEFDINVGGQVQLLAKGEWYVPDGPC